MAGLGAELRGGAGRGVLSSEHGPRRYGATGCGAAGGTGLRESRAPAAVGAAAACRARRAAGQR